MGGAVILDVVFAFDVKPGDYRIELVERAMAVVNLIVDAGTHLGEYPYAGLYAELSRRISVDLIPPRMCFQEVSRPSR